MSVTITAMTGDTRLCPVCGGALHLRLGVLECVECTYAEPVAGREAGNGGCPAPFTAGEQPPPDSPAENAETGACPPVAAMDGYLQQQKLRLALQIASSRNIAIVLMIMFFGRWMYASGLTVTWPFRLYESPSLPAVSQDANKKSLLFLMLVLGGTAYLAAAALGSQSKWLKWSIVSLLGACLTAAAAVVVSSLFSEVPLPALMVLPSQTRLALAAAVLYLLGSILWYISLGDKLAEYALKPPASS